MSVPEGYFDAFAATMADKLPFRAELESPEVIAEAERPRTVWQKVRPYVYMAAMFAGVWCMLQMFASLSALPSPSMSDNPVLANALADEDFVMDYVYDDVNSWEILSTKWWTTALSTMPVSNPNSRTDDSRTTFFP